MLFLNLIKLNALRARAIRQKKLRSKYLDAHATPKDKLNNHPPRVRLEDWEAFIEDNLSPKTIEKRKKKKQR